MIPKFNRGTRWGMFVKRGRSATGPIAKADPCSKIEDAIAYGLGSAPHAIRARLGVHERNSESTLHLLKAKGQQFFRATTTTAHGTAAWNHRAVECCMTSEL